MWGGREVRRRRPVRARRPPGGFLCVSDGEEKVCDSRLPDEAWESLRLPLFFLLFSQNAVAPFLHFCHIFASPREAPPLQSGISSLPGAEATLMWEARQRQSETQTPLCHSHTHTHKHADAHTHTHARSLTRRAASYLTR